MYIHWWGVKQVSLETCFSRAEILELIDGSIPPAPAVPASTRVSAKLKYVQEHSLPANTHACACVIWQERAYDVTYECNNTEIVYITHEVRNVCGGFRIF